MLAIVNSILVLVLTIIVAINIYYVMKLQYTQITIRDELENKIRQTIGNMDLSDLKEFRDVEPSTKQFYKAYLAGVIVPMVIKHFNVLLTSSKEYVRFKSTNDVDGFVEDVKDILDRATAEFLSNIQSKSNNLKLKHMQ